MVKVCSKCHREKDEKCFPLSYRKKTDGSMSRISICRECKREYAAEWRSINREHVNLRQREYNSRNRFRVTLIESRKVAKKRGHKSCSATIEELEASYTGYCHSCGVNEASLSTNLHMDHSHETGKLRGWLCNGCNLAAGYLQDSSRKAQLLAGYLNAIEEKKSPENTRPVR